METAVGTSATRPRKTPAPQMPSVCSSRSSAYPRPRIIASSAARTDRSVMVAGVSRASVPGSARASPASSIAARSAFPFAVEHGQVYRLVDRPGQFLKEGMQAAETAPPGGIRHPAYRWAEPVPAARAGRLHEALAPHGVQQPVHGRAGQSDLLADFGLGHAARRGAQPAEDFRGPGDGLDAPLARFLRRH